MNMKKNNMLTRYQAPILEFLAKNDYFRGSI